LCSGASSAEQFQGEPNNEQENETAHIGEERNSASQCLQAKLSNGMLLLQSD
jgi:hypothetical protein